MAPELSGAVPLDGVKGRLDHFASGQGQVFISALGNNTVEVINLFGGVVEHTITDVPNPQGVAFSPDAHKLFVASAMKNFIESPKTNIANFWFLNDFSVLGWIGSRSTNERSCKLPQ